MVGKKDDFIENMAILIFVVLVVVFLFYIVGPWAIKLVLEPLGFLLSHSERFYMIVGLSILTSFFRVSDG